MRERGGGWEEGEMENKKILTESYMYMYCSTALNQKLAYILTERASATYIRTTTIFIPAAESRGDEPFEEATTSWPWAGLGTGFIGRGTFKPSERTHWRWTPSPVRICASSRSTSGEVGISVHRGDCTRLVVKWVWSSVRSSTVVYKSWERERDGQKQRRERGVGGEKERGRGRERTVSNKAYIQRYVYITT